MAIRMIISPTVLICNCASRDDVARAEFSIRIQINTGLARKQDMMHSLQNNEPPYFARLL